MQLTQLQQAMLHTAAAQLTSAQYIGELVGETDSSLISSQARSLPSLEIAIDRITPLPTTTEFEHLIKVQCQAQLVFPVDATEVAYANNVQLLEDFLWLLHQQNWEQEGLSAAQNIRCWRKQKASLVQAGFNVRKVSWEHLLVMKREDTSPNFLPEAVYLCDEEDNFGHAEHYDLIAQVSEE